jgi:hypothetical protein
MRSSRLPQDRGRFKRPWPRDPVPAYHLPCTLDEGPVPFPHSDSTQTFRAHPQNTARTDVGHGDAAFGGRASLRLGRVLDGGHHLHHGDLVGARGTRAGRVQSHLARRQPPGAIAHRRHLRVPTVNRSAHRCRCYQAGSCSAVAAVWETKQLKKRDGVYAKQENRYVSFGSRLPCARLAFQRVQEPPCREERKRTEPSVDGTRRH